MQTFFVVRLRFSLIRLGSLGLPQRSRRLIFGAHGVIMSPRLPCFDVIDNLICEGLSPSEKREVQLEWQNLSPWISAKRKTSSRTIIGACLRLDVKTVSCKCR